MTKKEFIHNLEAALRAVPENERLEILSDYEEHFRAAAAAGEREEDTVRALGNPADIAREILDASGIEANSPKSLDGLIDRIVRRLEGVRFESAPVDETRTLSAENAVRLVIRTQSADVRTQRSDGGEIRARLRGETGALRPGGEVPALEVEERSGTVVVQVSEPRRSIWRGASLQLEITLPGRAFDEVSCDTATGDVDANGLQANRLRIESRTGDVRVSDSSAGQADLRTNTGDVQWYGTFRALQLKTNTGDVEILGDGPGAAVETNTGDVKIALKTLSGDISGHSNTGDVDLTVDSPPSRYRVELSTTTGSVRFERPSGTIRTGRRVEMEIGSPSGGAVPGASGPDPRVRLRSNTGDVTLSAGL